jgi:peptidoglycan/xylan/chitin deacetylase (PgdA/CDA1 family)/SAM-dependent methyltransferase
MITCRDLGRFLDEALASVERQTRPAAEILIVDDASADVYTRQTLARITRAGTRVVRAAGRGASAARNLGARLTTAPYLVWLDADDAFEPGYFAAAAAALDAEAELDFVSCAMRAFGDADYLWTPSRPAFVDAIATGGVPHASTMMRRALWVSAGGFDESLPSFELLDFWASALKGGARGTILGTPLLNYRVRSGSGYRRSIRDDVYRARCEHLYARHWDAVEREWPDLILAKEAFIEGQRVHRRSLEARAAALETELAGLQCEVTDAASALAARGVPRVSFGDLGVAPVSPRWGRDRGTPIDRYYIERFLERHRADIRGRVLEVREPLYATRFGGAAVAACDVVDRDAANPMATIVADLRRATTIGDATYDCIILTQTLQLIDEIPAALAECARILRPGGVLLATAPSTIRVDDEAGIDGDFWRLTEASARTLLANIFPIDAFDVGSDGNVKACTAFLHGVSVEEMPAADLNWVDAAFPLVVTMRAVKPAAPSPDTHLHTDGRRTAENRAVIVSYHRIANFSPDSHALCTLPETFRAHMVSLREHFTPMALEDLVHAAASGTIPAGAVAVTFDDGYVDALTTASPILSELGIPATFFVNSDRLDEPHERWWDILERVFLGDESLPPVLALRVGVDDWQAATSTAAERAAALDGLNRAAWPLDGPARRQLAADVLSWSGATAGVRPTHRVVTGDDIRVLAARPGHTIGAHTTNHLALTAHPAAAKRREIDDDKAALERVLGRAVPLFAYPYGEFDAETIGVVRDAGFHAAVTVDAGLVQAGTNRLLLPRIEITPLDADRDRFERRLREMLA